MKYSHFETLALVLGGIAIAASVFIAPAESPQAAEVAAQLLLILVLGSALHWGRNGGFLAALLALGLYVAMRFPLLQSQGLSSDILIMLGTRSLTYAVVGILGGELASRIKYVFARLEDDALIDQVTGVYSARYAAETIVSGLGQYERYRSDFSVVRIAIADEAYSALRQARYRQAMKQIASHLRGDVRMVDDLAFSAPGTFLVLLPGTPETGACVVADRLGPAVRNMLDASVERLDVTVLSASSSALELRQLAEKLWPNPQDDDRPRPMTERRAGSREPRQEPVA